MSDKDPMTPEELADVVRLTSSEIQLEAAISKPAAQARLDVIASTLSLVAGLLPQLTGTADVNRLHERPPLAGGL